MGKLNGFLLLGFLLLAGVSASRLAFDDDEFQHAHMAWLLARGEVPHRDFFEHHLPLYHGVLAPLTLGTPGPDRILLLRGGNVLLAAGTVLLLSRAIRLWTGSAGAGVMCWVALSPVFLVKMIEVRPEGFCMFLAAASLCALGGERKRSVLAGLLAGAMVMGSQKFVFPAAGLFVLAWMEHGFRGGVRFAVGGAVFPLLILAGYAAAGAGPKAWEQLVILNVNWKERFSPAMYAGMLWTHSAVLISFAAAGLLTRGHTRAKRAAGVLMLAGIAAVLLIPIPFRQTFLMLFPGLALSAAIAWKALDQAVGIPRIPHKTGRMVLVILGLMPAAYGLGREFETTLEKDLQLMRTLHARTRGPFFDGRGLMFHRPHVGYYPWLHEGLMLMLDEEEYARETESAIRESGFPNVLWDYRIAHMPEALQTFLRESYVAVEPGPLMVPGIRVDRARLAGEGITLRLPSPGTWRVTWQGGEVWMNEELLRSGDRFVRDGKPFTITARGFVREFQIVRVEDGL
ncbi:MAG: hypothetical protein WD708_04135 [Kiritimatiellia bacterium]